MDARLAKTFTSLLPVSLVGSGSAKKADLTSIAPIREVGSNHLIYLSKLISRFWEKVDIRTDDKCWNWTASKKGKDYGQFYIHGYKMVFAHRVAWVIKNGAIPNDLFVLHKCNNSLCCNPNHLYLGTLSDNSQDSIKAGTHVWSNGKGEKHPHSKLKDCDVLEIRRLYATGKIKTGTLAKMFLVSRSQIRRIIIRSKWKHI